MKAKLALCSLWPRKTVSRAPTFALFVAFASVGLCEPAPNPLVGTWKLITYTDMSQDGQPWFPFGTQPKGQFVFTADGHFSAGIECDQNGSVPAELPVPEFDDLTKPFVGYFGRYTFDPGSATVVWNIDGSSAPSYVGSSVSTSVSRDGSRLIMKGTSIRRNGRQWSWERVLERE